MHWHPCEIFEHVPRNNVELVKFFLPVKYCTWINFSFVSFHVFVSAVCTRKNLTVRITIACAARLRQEQQHFSQTHRQKRKSQNCSAVTWPPAAHNMTGNMHRIVFPGSVNPVRKKQITVPKKLDFLFFDPIWHPLTPFDPIYSNTATVTYEQRFYWTLSPFFFRIRHVIIVVDFFTK
jgi:hypothetical protein